MRLAGEELYGLDEEAMLSRRPQKAAGNLVDENRLVVGIVEPQETRAEDKPAMRGADGAIRREAKMQFQRHWHIGVDTDFAPAGDERDLIERDVMDVEIAREVGRGRAFGLVEGQLEAAKDGAALFLLVVDDELAARDRNAVDRADRAVRSGDGIE